MNRELLSLICLLGICPFSLSKLEADGVSLARSGVATSEILVSDHDKPRDGVPSPISGVEGSAGELAQVISGICGVKPVVIHLKAEGLQIALERAKADNKTVILLGALALQYLGPLTEPQRAALLDPSGFLFRVKDGVIAIAGSEPRGTEIGVYELLEQLGVRWFFPGKWGTVIPKSKDLEISVQDIVQKPTFASRYLGFDALDKDPAISAWKKHQREGGLILPPAHGIRLSDDAIFSQHPEFYALIDGKRTNRQLCISNPDVLKRAIEQTRQFFRENPTAPWIGMGPNDGSGFCECADCRALDGGGWDPFSNERSLTDRYIWFFNQVLAGIHDEFPDKKIVFYAYFAYSQPPLREKPNPKIVAALAPIELCRVHGMNNPICPERGYLKTLIDGWTKILPDVYERGYWFNLADPGMEFIQVHRMRDEIPYYATHGIKGFRTECVNQWAVQGPSLYLAEKLMWNAEADPDAIVSDFCQKLFGPAAEPMERFFTLLDHRLRDADYHTGSAFDLLHFYPAELRQKAAGILGAAAHLALNSPYKERVQIFSKGFAFTESFAEMLEARNEQHWGAAEAALKKMDILREQLISYDPPMLSSHASESYLRRFFRGCIEQGFARVTSGNRIVAPLTDEWSFLLDPEGIGESLHYERGSVIGGNWQKILTCSSTWSDQGLRYYKGLAWYRQTVEIPQEFGGKRIFLWFGGVDETAKVWINGQLLGTSPNSAFTPFELDASRALHSGKNDIAVCVANLRTDELGMGGITAPAFFYAPSGGARAQLENVQPLRATFP